MIIKLLQLNINSDNFWDKLIPYLKTHDFDVLHFQEVTGKNTIAGNINAKRDTFIELQKTLQGNYNSELSITQRYTSSPDAYMGNAIFYKKQFTLIKKNEITLSSFEPFPKDSTDYENVGRKVLHLTLEIEKKQISFLNAHAAWGRDHIEKPFQTKQGDILLTYLKTVNPPFVLTGDFNITPEQPLMQKISSLTRNLITENNITNTLNPKNHRAKVLFPKGLAVDYIFTSKELQSKNFAVIDEGLSDHFGLTAEIKL
jgi:endonuclease/exonuclease/phosphatase family metal-dependent hydrolase